MPTDSTKKLPTWRRGCQKFGKITNVVYGWSKTFPSPALDLFLVATLESKLPFVMLLKRNLCTPLYIAIVFFTDGVKSENLGLRVIMRRAGAAATVF